MFRVICVVPVFPATSVAVPETVCLAPSAETTTGAGHCATPERESAQLKLTVTFVLFQPAASGSGNAAAAKVGGVLSMFSFALAVAVMPALLIAVPWIT